MVPYCQITVSAACVESALACMHGVCATDTRHALQSAPGRDRSIASPWGGIWHRPDWLIVARQTCKPMCLNTADSVLAILGTASYAEPDMSDSMHSPIHNLIIV